MKAVALQRRLWRALGPRADVLRMLVRQAEACGAHAFLVGGPVRDLLLAREVGDLDVLLTGGLERIARGMAAELGGRVVFRPRFLTATVRAPGAELDLARARREHYARPGALPQVRAAALREDLGRRDFSIHSLALPLHEGAGSRLLDPHGGIADLRAGLLRVLHDESFRDDPTRLLRAARYGARLDFRLEPRTRRLARSAIENGALETLSGDRLRHELERLLREPRARACAARTARLGLFDALIPGWRPRAGSALARLARVVERPPWTGADGEALRARAGVALLLLGSPPPLRARVLERLSLRGRLAQAISADLDELERLRRRLSARLSPGRLDAALDETRESALLLAYCAGPGRVTRQVVRFAGDLRSRPSPIDGRRARALVSGPAIGELLRAARTRALDGRRVDDAWLERWLARHR